MDHIFIILAVLCEVSGYCRVVDVDRVRAVGAK